MHSGFYLGVLVLCSIFNRLIITSNLSLKTKTNRGMIVLNIILLLSFVGDMSMTARALMSSGAG